MPKLIFDNCSQCDCGKRKVIVNRTHYLCNDKNNSRLDNQRTIKKEKTKTILKTKKQSDIDQKYVKVCKEIDDEREKICSGCNRYQSGDVKLSHSHIISRSESKRLGKPELIYNKENITYHCMDFGENKGCHLKWETKQRRYLLDFEKNLLFIKKHSVELYNKLLMDM